MITLIYFVLILNIGTIVIAIHIKSYFIHFIYADTQQRRRNMAGCRKRRHIYILTNLSELRLVWSLNIVGWHWRIKRNEKSWVSAIPRQMRLIVCPQQIILMVNSVRYSLSFNLHLHTSLIWWCMVKVILWIWYMKTFLIWFLGNKKCLSFEYIWLTLFFSGWLFLLDR
jgi:hypothetical protein